jgi:hypothetical protein
VRGRWTGLYIIQFTFSCIQGLQVRGCKIYATMV